MRGAQHGIRYGPLRQGERSRHGPELLLAHSEGQRGPSRDLPELRNPIKDLRRRRRKGRNSKAVDEAVLDQLMSGITVLRDKAMVALYLSTGLRLTELRSLNRYSISFDLRVSAQGVQSVSGSGQVLGKGSKLRRFNIDPETLPLYANYLQSRTDENPALFISERKLRISARAIQYTVVLV